MARIFTFANDLAAKLELEPLQIELLLSDKTYPTSWGYKVLPLYARMVGEDITCELGFEKLLELFERVPYIYINETRNRRVFKQFMKLTLFMVKKEYEGCEYYDYSIDPVRNRSMIPKISAMKEHTFEVIKKFHEQNVGEIDFDEL